MGVLGQPVGNEHTDLTDGIFHHLLSVCYLAYGIYLRMVISEWEEPPIK